MVFWVHFGRILGVSKWGFGIPFHVVLVHVGMYFGWFWCILGVSVSFWVELLLGGVFTHDWVVLGTFWVCLGGFSEFFVRFQVALGAFLGAFRWFWVHSGCISITFGAYWVSPAGLGRPAGAVLTPTVHRGWGHPH